MRADEIRETYLSFFEQRDHKRMPSASLVPEQFDASVLLTTAGMQPFKPYFRGDATPPARRLTSVQKCFRTTDIEQVGNTARHLTMFEMLGNFSFGDYFKREAIGFGYELSTDGFGLDPARIWITVFGGDDDLGLGPDEDAIEFWREQGVDDERIVRLGRSDNFWQAGPTGPCGPCSELYLDRGFEFGGPDDLPGDDTERFLEFWNLVFMQYELKDDGSLTELPAKNIDTGMGLDRMAAILQDCPSVYETDHFAPLIELGEELSGRQSGSDPAVTRSLRILADHGRAMTFLIADGVVPSNEDRGYILRRIMRRAIQHGKSLGLDEFLVPLTTRVIEVMASAYPSLTAERAAITNWVAAEEQSFSRTLEQGTLLLGQLVEQAKASNTPWIDPADAFQLHDTYGFPYDMTRELLAEQGLSVDDSGFEELMEAQRERARSGSLRSAADSGGHAVVTEFVRNAGVVTEFVGYDRVSRETKLVAVMEDPRSVVGSATMDASNTSAKRLLVKLAESPFYAEGGGQVSDDGVIEIGATRARVVDVYRVDGDQAIAVELDGDELVAGDTVCARVDGSSRHATATHHTATHLLHAALRERLGNHVHQAGSSVRPDKLRFDFSHGAPLTNEDIVWVENRINGWITQNHDVHAIEMPKSEAEKLGAMALFGEKYGEWVRMVEIGKGEFSRELCGGTHVRSTAEIGAFLIGSESSSAANVRRIEAFAGPAAVSLLRDHDAELRSLARTLRTTPDQVSAAVVERERKLTALQAQGGASRVDLAGLSEAIADQAVETAGHRIVVAAVPAADFAGDAKILRELSDRVRDRLAGIAIVGSVIEGSAQVLVNVHSDAVAAGVDGGQAAKAAAQVLGGGGGGRPNMAQAGGPRTDKLESALEAARVAVAKQLGDQAVAGQSTK